VTADDGAFNGATAAGGGTFSHLFTTTGTFAYHCAIHPSMTGTVIVSGQ
jgi:plastocyanin